ncbi:MAG TPA: AI-2E family transporter [Caldimonas sp.]|jgi:predicted PurR-regulated permease PerM|nr:AI-2E family transporter [Caldimonas sp.]HEX4232923.1 AI-2E family transporter [Caldimonas sp.]
MALTAAQRRSLNWAALAAAAFAFVWLFGPVLTPFLIGAVLAYALHPLVEQLAARRMPRLAAVMLVEIGAIAVLAGLMLLIVPILSKELPLLNEQLPLLAERINRALTPWLKQMGIDVSLDPANLRGVLLRYLDANWGEGLAAALASARIGGSIVVAIVGYLVLVPVALFFLLIDWPLYVLRATALIPPRLRARVTSFTSDCDTVLGQYLRGQMIVMLLMAAFYSVGLALFGFDLAVPVGVFTGLAIFVPYVGFGIGLLLALLAGALQFSGWYGPLAVVVVYGIGQVVEGLFLTPKMVGERIGMSPLTVIFALFAFGHLFGFVGVLIALPASALIAVAAARLRAGYTQSNLYSDG